MGLFGNILKIVVDVVETPIAICKDVITMGGSLDGKNETYTEEKLEELKDDLINIDK